MILSLSLVQTLFPFSTGKELNGYAAASQNKPSLTLRAWLNGDYQSKMQQYLNDSCGFHNDFIRLRNQIYYSCFNICPNETVIMGKENFLYHMGYIDAVNGINYLGEDSIYRKVQVIKRLQDTLAKRGQRMIIIFAPGKGSFYPEFIPDRYLKMQQPHTNHATYIEACKHYNVENIDLLSWFVAMKDTATYPLFPKTGVHWSRYSQMFVIDSLIKYFTAGTYCNNSFKITSLNPKDKAEGNDLDCENTLNLIRRMKTNTPLAYPEYEMIIDSNYHRLKTIVVSDSYYWQIFHDISNTLFKEGEYWYYYHEINYTDSLRRYNMPLSIDSVSRFDELKSADLIIVMASDCNLRYLGGDYMNNGYGIIEDLNKHFFGENNPSKHSKQITNGI
jgi:hypothetical protein